MNTLQAKYQPRNRHYLEAHLNALNSESPRLTLNVSKSSMSRAKHPRHYPPTLWQRIGMALVLCLKGAGL